MKPRRIQSIADFDAASPPPEGGRFICHPLPAQPPAGHQFTGHVYTSHPKHYPANHCVQYGQPFPDAVPVELRKYHTKIEVEWRRVKPIQPRKGVA